LEEKGLNPKDFNTWAAFVRMLTVDKDGTMIMTVEEVRDTMVAAFGKVELRDLDHLYVPGRFIHLHDRWSKQCAVEMDEKIANKAKETDDEKDAVEEEMRRAERLYVGDGASNILRYIEIDARMLTGHLSPGHRSSIMAVRRRNG
jgi:hypothetical protein